MHSNMQNLFNLVLRCISYLPVRLLWSIWENVVEIASVKTIYSLQHCHFCHPMSLKPTWELKKKHFTVKYWLSIVYKTTVFPDIHWIIKIPLVTKWRQWQAGVTIYYSIDVDNNRSLRVKLLKQDDPKGVRIHERGFWKQPSKSKVVT